MEETTRGTRHVRAEQRNARPPEAEEEIPHTRRLDESPRSVYEIVTRQMLEGLRDDLSEVKGRVNALLWLLAGTILAEFVMRLVR
jgi:hypothetical protein